jgi:hypothetical protein
MTARGPYTLSDEIARFIAEMNDPFVHRLLEHLRTFSDVTMRHVTTKSAALLYISDQKFQELGAKLGTPEKINRLTISHVVRMTEAFRVSSVLRATEHLKSSIWNLNARQFVAAAPSVRAMTELTVQNLDGANTVYHYLKNLKWDLFNHTILLLSGKEGEESLNDYVDKLYFGTRREAHLVGPHLQQTNILTVLKRMSKKLKDAAGHDVLEKYEYVCELVHPNRAGFEIFVGPVERVDGYWERYPIAIDSATGRTAEVLEYLLWLLSFSVGTLLSVQAVYNEINLLVHRQIGSLYPKP